MKEKGFWGRFKETALKVAEYSTFITVPLGGVLAIDAFLSKEFAKSVVLTALVGVDLLMYKYLKNRRQKAGGNFAQLREAGLNQLSQTNNVSGTGSERFFKTSPRAVSLAK